MNRVTFQNAAYFHTASFEADVERSGLAPARVTMALDGRLVCRDVSHTEACGYVVGRVGTYSNALHKSFSAFQALFSDPREQMRALLIYRAAVLFAAMQFLKEYQDRTGAQGKRRMPGAASITVFFHVETHDGHPHVHAHVVLEPESQIRTTGKNLRTNYRELYRLRERFAAHVTSQVAFDLRREFGVRVESRRPGEMRLPDVPRRILDLFSERSRQIDRFLAQQGLPNNPDTRRLGALATRRGHVSQVEGRRTVERERRAGFFHSEQICSRIQSPQKADGAPERPLESKYVVAAANTLARRTGFFTRVELEVAVTGTFLGYVSPAAAMKAVAVVLKDPRKFGVRRESNRRQEPYYSTPQTVRSTGKLFRAVATLNSPSGPAKSLPFSSVAKRRLPSPTPDKSTGRSASTPTPSMAPRPVSASRQHFEEKGPGIGRIFEDSKGFVAFGEDARRFKDWLKELWRDWRCPVRYVDARLWSGTPGSLQNLVRDLKIRGMIASHGEAWQAFRSRRFDGILAAAGRAERRFENAIFTPRHKLKRDAVIVVNHASHGSKKDIDFLARRVRRAGAKLVLCESWITKQQAQEHAQSMRRGAALRIEQERAAEYGRDR